MPLSTLSRHLRPGPRQLHAAVRFLQQRVGGAPQLAFVLGSGFGSVANLVRSSRIIPWARLPGFPQPTVPGHCAELEVGTRHNVAIVILRGRTHYYEGYSLHELTFPIRVLAAWGVRDLILTNAAGGIDPAYRPGDFMLIQDHINGLGDNPLRGPEWPGQMRFVDLTHAYDATLSRGLVHAARLCGIRLHRGVYLAVSGPSYETPAEIRAFARLGAHAVGMSTVPEVIVARQCGLRVAAVSCITNLAAGRSRRPLSHEEVLANGAQVAKQVEQWFDAFLHWYAHHA
ncbi:MAG: purine-nucleoside phosphorylase [Verrucomicrobiota bacterium]|nr:purine-nucleoside phosphorylase [Limisphaera sp.]MDW8380526.1 purine-nucleoside phosphorylase [Verrucomicrobiota bacterium]